MITPKIARHGSPSRRCSRAGRLSFPILAWIAFLAGPLAAGGFGSPEAGDIRIGFALTDEGFCGLEARIQYAPLSGLWAGLILRSSALTLFRGDFDTGEAALTGEWIPEARFDLRLAAEAGIRYQNQNLGRITALYTEETLKAGFPASGWAAGLLVARRDDWLTRTELSPWAQSCFDDRYPDSEPAPRRVTMLFAGGETKIGAYGEWNVGKMSRFSLACGARLHDTPFVSGFEGMMFGVFPFFADIGISLGL